MAVPTYREERGGGVYMTTPSLPPIRPSGVGGSLLTEYAPTLPQSIPTAEDHNLMLWAREMGLRMPYEDESACQGWPKSASSWGEEQGSAMEQWAAQRGGDHLSPEEQGVRFEYGVGLTREADSEYDGASGSQQSSSGGMGERGGVDFHHRKALNYHTRQRLEAGNGDIITWSQMG